MLGIPERPERRGKIGVSGSSDRAIQRLARSLRPCGIQYSVDQRRRIGVRDVEVAAHRDAGFHRCRIHVSVAQFVGEAIDSLETRLRIVIQPAVGPQFQGAVACQ